jgi:hypothetical protein
VADPLEGLPDSFLQVTISGNILPRKLFYCPGWGISYYPETILPHLIFLISQKNIVKKSQKNGEIITRENMMQI